MSAAALQQSICDDQYVYCAQKIPSIEKKAVNAPGLIAPLDEFLASQDNLEQAVSALINAVRCALSGERNDAREFLDAAICSIGPERTTVDEAKPAKASVSQFRGGLAPWQVRSVATHIDEHIGECVRCDVLSALVRLSLSHFMRAFRESFGCPPHAYIMRRRLERAQGLMLSTAIPLGQIALECGFADQSHLSRLFQRLTGESPAIWRRARTLIAGDRTCGSSCGDAHANVPAF